jgi:hypothetical protein
VKGRDENLRAQFLEWQGTHLRFSVKVSLSRSIVHPASQARLTGLVLVYHVVHM